jgi:hypothetical protein
MARRSARRYELRYARCHTRSSATHHSSVRWFWMGLPVMMSRCTVCTCLAARVTSASGFLQGCQGHFGARALAGLPGSFRHQGSGRPCMPLRERIGHVVAVCML